MEKETENNKPKAHNVGYGRPPKEHKFKPGKSGNPKGRPKGSKNKPFGKNRLNKLEEMILAEGDRHVTIRDGTDMIKIPAIQATLRSTIMSAIKGNTTAQRLSLEARKWAMTNQELDSAAIIDSIMRYLAWCDQEERRCKKEGKKFDPEGPLPKQIHIDYETGTIIVQGPATRETRSFKNFLVKKAQKTAEQIKQLSRREDPSFSRTLEMELELDELIKSFYTIESLVKKLSEPEILDRSNGRLIRTLAKITGE